MHPELSNLQRLILMQRLCGDRVQAVKRGRYVVCRLRWVRRWYAACAEQSRDLARATKLGLLICSVRLSLGAECVRTVGALRAD